MHLTLIFVNYVEAIAQNTLTRCSSPPRGTSNSYSTGPGIYGDKLTESEGVAINPWQPVL